MQIENAFVEIFTFYILHSENIYKYLRETDAKRRGHFFPPISESDFERYDLDWLYDIK